MRKICLFLAFVLAVTLFCACNEENENSVSTESGSNIVNDSDENNTPDESNDTINDDIESDVQGDESDSFINDTNESDTPDESDSFINDSIEGDTPDESNGLINNDSESDGSDESNVTESSGSENHNDTQTSSEIGENSNSSPSSSSPNSATSVLCKTQEEFEECIRQEDGTLPNFYIPWKQILPFGQMEVVALNTPLEYCHSHGVFPVIYTIIDEQGNKWSMWVEYNTAYCDKNPIEVLDMSRSEASIKVEGVLLQSLSSDYIGTANISTGYYVDDAINPGQVYYYRDGVLKEIRFMVNEFEIVIRTNFDQIAEGGNSIQSSSAADITPQTMISYQGLQNVIKRAGDNITEHITKFEATE